jgi:hypothetical protein
MRDALFPCVDIDLVGRRCTAGLIGNGGNGGNGGFGPTPDSPGADGAAVIIRTGCPVCPSSPESLAFQQVQ